MLLNKFQLVTELLQSKAQIITNSVLGVFVAVVNYTLGGWSQELAFLLIVMTADILSGWAASIIEGTGLSSKLGFKGMLKKAMMFLVLTMCYRADILFGTNILFIGSCYFYIANELISITENYGRCGLPMPKQLKDIISILKSKSHSNSSEEDDKQ